MQHEAGGGIVVPGVQALRQGADVDALGVQLLDGPEPLGQVPGQAVDPRDHDDVAGLERLPECRPPGAAHVPARSHVGEDAVVPEPVVGEDAVLGVQPARALRLGYPDVAEYRWVHGVASPRGNKTLALCLDFAHFLKVERPGTTSCLQPSWTPSPWCGAICGWRRRFSHGRASSLIVIKSSRFVPSTHRVACSRHLKMRKVQLI